MFSFLFQKPAATNKRYKKINGVTQIEMIIKNADYLFDGRDPAPFREKDLDEDAAKYITTSLREINLEDKVHLKIFITQPRGPQDQIPAIKAAIHNYFDYEADLKKSERQHILRMAFKSLFIGLTVLSFCIYSAEFLAGRESFFAKFLSEGLHILGWYSMWKPVYFGLYEWWPIRDEELLLRRAGDLEIDVVYSYEAQTEKATEVPFAKPIYS